MLVKIQGVIVTSGEDGLTQVVEEIASLTRAELLSCLTFAATAIFLYTQLMVRVEL